MKIQLEQIKTNMEKKSDFVDSGFVKTCDELVIGSKVFKERGLTYTSESIMDEHY